MFAWSRMYGSLLASFGCGFLCLYGIYTVFGFIISHGFNAFFNHPYSLRMGLNILLWASLTCFFYLLFTKSRPTPDSNEDQPIGL